MVIYITHQPLFRILPTRHITTLTNLVCRNGLIRMIITHGPHLMTIIFILSTLHRVSGDSPPPSPLFSQLVLLLHPVHNLFKIHNQIQALTNPSLTKIK